MTLRGSSLQLCKQCNPSEMLACMTQRRKTEEDASSDLGARAANVTGRAKGPIRPIQITQLENTYGKLANAEPKGHYGAAR
jgi:hypothetical protein